MSIRITLINPPDEDRSTTFDSSEAAIAYLESLFDVKANAAAKEQADENIAKAESDLEVARAARAALEAPPEAPGDHESATPEKSGLLPDDFPGVTYLRASHPPIDTYAKARAIAEAEELTTIDGIGSATADKIKAALR